MLKVFRQRRLLTRALALPSDERGSLAVEFALLSVPFMGLLFCILELGVVFLLGNAVEAMTTQIARQIKTGQLQQQNIQTVADFRSKLLCPSGGNGLLPSYLSCDRVAVDIRTSDALSDADLTDEIYQQGFAAKFCLGQPGSIVIVRVAYSFPAILPFLAIATGGGITAVRAGLVNDVPNYPGWNHMIFKTSGFQNEAYGGLAQTCS